MKTISIALEAHFAQPGRPRAACLSLTRTDDVVIRGTSWDSDIPFDGQTYYHTSGGTVTDVETTAALNVDDVSITANFDSVTAADLKAGIYDYAAYDLFLVNPLDLTMGKYSQKVGNIGVVTVDRLTFIAELHGRMRALQQSFGRTVTPTCPYILGSTARLALGLHDCQKDLTAFTHSGTLDGVSADQMTMYDGARAEAGPAGSIAITAITNANPAVVTTASPLTQGNRTAVTFSAIVGPVALNGVLTIENKSGSTFQINVNTTDTGDYPAFVSGTVTPLGAESGYFDYGLMTVTSGPNLGISREVKSYVPGQWTLQDPFPYPLVGTETYTMIAGDDKTWETCRVKFANGDNFGGFPFVPGQDSMMQVARAA